MVLASGGVSRYGSVQLIHEKLIAKWSELKRYLRADRLYFTCLQNEEDLMTISYLRDTAHQARIQTEHLFINEIGWNTSDSTFRDLQEQEITSLFALYPWEWLLKDFGEPLVSALPGMDWIEPIWKMLWSNKALLAVLWEMFPNHTNLLPAFMDGPQGMVDFVRKPLLSREGANITIHQEQTELSTGGPYGAEGFVYQALAPNWNATLPTPVLGSWYITGKGITDNLSRFVPHFFD